MNTDGGKWLHVSLMNAMRKMWAMQANMTSLEKNVLKALQFTPRRLLQIASLSPYKSIN